MKSYAGVLITIEGGHGSGKSAVAEMLVERLQANDIDFVSTIDQQGTEIGRRTRAILLDEEFESIIDPRTEALLVSVARCQNRAQIIEPALAQGKIVICERYTDALIAFQYGAAGLPLEDIEAINAFVSNGIEPDLTLLLVRGSARTLCG